MYKYRVENNHRIIPEGVAKVISLKISPTRYPGKIARRLLWRISKYIKTYWVIIVDIELYGDFPGGQPLCYI